MSDALFPSNPELAEIHVEDVKDGYVLLHPELGNGTVTDQPFPYINPDGDRVVDVPVSFPRDGYRLVQWLTYELGEIVTVEA